MQSAAVAAEFFITCHPAPPATSPSSTTGYRSTARRAEESFYVKHHQLVQIEHVSAALRRLMD
jgi:hypothetical protein